MHQYDIDSNDDNVEQPRILTEEEKRRKMGEPSINRLAVSIISFLKKELERFSANEQDADASESIEVAIQCLESAYSIDEQKIKDANAPDLAELFLLDAAQDEPGYSPGYVISAQAAEIYKKEGNVLMRLEKYADAEKRYSRAIEMDSTNAVYFCNRAAARSKLNNHSGAVEDCSMALHIDPSYSKAYGRLGIAYSALSQLDLAKSCYLKALELEPDNESYKNNLALCNEQLQKKTGTTSESAAETSSRFGPAGPAAPNLAPGENLDLSSLMNNPALMSMASQMLNNPNVQNLMAGLMSGVSGNGGVEALLNAGHELARQMQETNPSFMDQLRGRGPSSQPPQPPQADGDHKSPPNPPSDGGESQ